MTFEGSDFRAPGNTMLPPPCQRPHPPIWIGGNSRRAIRRAVELADGWSPFPTTPRTAERTRTATLTTPADLARELAYAAEHAERVGRTEPLTVAFVPSGMLMTGDQGFDAASVLASLHELAAVGVSWVTVALPGDTRVDQLEAIERFGSAVLAKL